MQQVNLAEAHEDYAAALEEGDVENAAAFREEGMLLDAATHPVFKEIVAATTAFDWEDNTVFPYETTAANIDCLEGAIGALDEGDVETALEWLTGVDYNWYAYSFSQETYEYMLDKMFNKAEGTWGEDMIRFDGENLWTLMHSLMEKADDENPDFQAELDELQDARERQFANLAQLDEQMCADVARITESIRTILAD